MIQLGMQLPSLAFDLATDAENAFTAQWLNSQGEEYDLTGVTVRLVVDKDGPNETTFTAVNSAGAYSNWTISAAAALPVLIGKSVRLEWVYGGDVYLMAQGTVRAA